MEKVKVYSEGTYEDDCNHEFEGLNGGHRIVWACTRKEHKTGPHQWVSAQKRQNEGEEASTDIFTETDAAYQKRMNERR